LDVLKIMLFNLLTHYRVNDIKKSSWNNTTESMCVEWNLPKNRSL